MGSITLFAVILAISAFSCYATQESKKEDLGAVLADETELDHLQESLDENKYPPAVKRSYGYGATNGVPHGAIPGGAMPGGAMPGGAMPGGASPGEDVISYYGQTSSSRKGRKSSKGRKASSYYSNRKMKSSRKGRNGYKGRKPSSYRNRKMKSSRKGGKGYKGRKPSSYRNRKMKSSRKGRKGYKGRKLSSYRNRKMKSWRKGGKGYKGRKPSSYRNRKMKSWRKGRKGYKGGKSWKYGGKVIGMTGWSHSHRWGQSWGKGRGRGSGRNRYRRPFDCVAKPCQNQGVCCHDGGYSRCLCPAGFTGNQCERDINECARNRCPRGAKCFDQVNGFSCIFPDSKEFCRKKQTDCAKKPCKNGGKCKANKRGYVCECRPGFGGRNCQTNIDECLSAPCENGGTCVDGINKFTCKCASGYGGMFCQDKKGQCKPGRCLNGGECSVSKGDNRWNCICKRGFAGERCERVVKGCSTNPCRNGGTCCEVKDGYRCRCDDGFTGKNCEKRVEDMNIKLGQGQLEFKMSGSDNPKSKEYSRVCRYDNARQCIVCGRGYYLRAKSRKQVVRDLVKACKFSKRVAMRIAKAAGLSGKKARRCLKKYRLSKIRFSRRQQRELFQLDFKRQKKVADRYLKKRCRKGFQIKKLNPFILDVTMALFNDNDLLDNSRERKQCTKRILADIQSGDVRRMNKLFRDQNFWLKKVKMSRKKLSLMRNACKRECKRTRRC